MTSTINATDAASSGAAVPIMLTELRLPTIKVSGWARHLDDERRANSAC